MRRLTILTLTDTMVCHRTAIDVHELADMCDHANRYMAIKNETGVEDIQVPHNSFVVLVCPEAASPSINFIQIFITTVPAMTV